MIDGGPQIVGARSAAGPRSCATRAIEPTAREQQDDQHGARYDDAFRLFFRERALVPSSFSVSCRYAFSSRGNATGYCPV